MTGCRTAMKRLRDKSSRKQAAQARFLSSFPLEKEVTRAQFLELFKLDQKMSAKYFGTQIVCEHFEDAPIEQPKRISQVISDAHFETMMAEVERMWECCGDVLESYYDPVKQIGVKIRSDLKQTWYDKCHILFITLKLMFTLK